MAMGDVAQRIAVLNGTLDPSELTPSNGVISQQLDILIEQGGTGGGAPDIIITTISGGHNVAFYYGDGDDRNKNFDVMDGVDGTNGTNGQDGYTPVRGTDYWTANDIATIDAYIDQELGLIINGSY